MKKPKPFKIWVIADTHFNHAKLEEMEGRPADFNERIIKNWSNLVSDDDLVIHLGDVIIGRQSEMEGILKRVPGRKVLVRGNHDHEKPGYYLRRGFEFVCDQFILDKVVYSHVPLERLPEGCIANVHGHLHKNRHRPGGGEDWHKLIQIEDTLAPVLMYGGKNE